MHDLDLSLFTPHESRGFFGIGQETHNRDLALCRIRKSLARDSFDSAPSVFHSAWDLQRYHSFFLLRVKRPELGDNELIEGTDKILIRFGEVIDRYSLPVTDLITADCEELQSPENDQSCLYAAAGRPRIPEMQPLPGQK